MAASKERQIHSPPGLTASYLSNTTNMRQHLVRFHPETEKDPPTVPTTQRTILETVSKLPKNSQKAKSITKAIATFIVTDLRPYSVVNNRGFRLVVRTMEPRYKLPHRKHFAEKEIPHLYNETKARYTAVEVAAALATKANVLASMEKASRIALTCDAWTSVATKSFVTITAHFVLASDKNGWKLVSHVLQTREMSESHTGANVAELLKLAAAEWQISDKDLVLVTDNASNMVVAAQKANFVHLKCYAHTANLASQKALKLAAVAKLLARIRRISTFFHRSTTGLHLLEENQKLLGLKRHKLKTDVCTRWNSAYEMTERFLEQQPAIAATLLSPQLRKKETDIATLNENDVSNAEEMVSALKPMKDATTLMSQEKNPSACLIAPVHTKLLQNTEPNTEDSPLVRDIKKAIHDDLSSSEAEKSLLYTASALDPRFKALPFLSEEEREQTYGKVIAEAASLEVRVEEETPEDNARAAAVVTTPEPISAYTRAKDEMAKYRLALTPSLQEDPLLWWSVHQVLYPMIANVAKRYLCIPGSSVSAERVFSTAGDIVTAQRSTLKSEHIDQLVFLHKNIVVVQANANTNNYTVVSTTRPAFTTTHIKSQSFRWRAFAYPVEVGCTGSTPRLIKSLEVTGSKLRTALKDRAEEVEQGYSWLLALQKGQGMGKARIVGLA
ncbi:Zinc finger BED domain-containing protein 1 [Merluccius polli]|uniref:Zinc finger BED domain-containing protein 1 n=1 Tax=Merluccius polli TaxID=89951 RepID=A0AA47N6E5_MERPO|nr:Zinc finger BED domain-containing protein 1 [Merluccius polli]